MPDPQPAQIQRQGNAQDPEPSEEEPAIQAQSLYTSIYQRIQRQAQGSSRVGSGLENRLFHSKQGGTPLPDHVQAFMGTRLGVDLSPIRVHTDSSAVQMNRDLGAQAFAHGNHVYYMISDRQYQDPMCWLGLALTLIGVIPSVGSVVKSASKVILKGADEVVGKLDELLDLLRRISPELADIGSFKCYLDQTGLTQAH